MTKDSNQALPSDHTHTKTLRPDPRAYAMCIERFGLPGHECVFVDDQLRNVERRRRASPKVVHFGVTQPKGSYREALCRPDMSASKG